MKILVDGNMYIDSQGWCALSVCGDSYIHLNARAANQSPYEFSFCYIPMTFEQSSLVDD